jgi:hypothetical protein
MTSSYGRQKGSLWFIDCGQSPLYSRRVLLQPSLFDKTQDAIKSGVRSKLEQILGDNKGILGARVKDVANPSIIVRLIRTSTALGLCPCRVLHFLLLITPGHRCGRICVCTAQDPVEKFRKAKLVSGIQTVSIVVIKSCFKLPPATYTFDFPDTSMKCNATSELK